MKTSKYEEQIIRLLRAAGVKFIREKTYDDLKGGRFRFDFYLPGFECLLEIDGEQHFRQVAKFQRTRAEFLKQQEHDRQKNSYCLAHNIALFRIPYWELPNIKQARDLFQRKFRVLNRWHNDYLVPK